MHHHDLVTNINSEHTCQLDKVGQDNEQLNENMQELQTKLEGLEKDNLNLFELGQVK